jgi:DNA-binding NarL/FixJ family response regulator
MPAPSHNFHPSAPNEDEPVGLVLLDASLSPIYLNSSARQIISHSIENKRLSEDELAETIRSEMFKTANGPRLQQSTFVSGRRKYVCRKLLLEVPVVHPEGAYCAIVLERISRRDESLRLFVEKVQLSFREREVASLLAQGLTSNEIAHRMKISAHSVKGYVQFIMVKLGVTTRSRRVGKLGREPDGNEDSEAG